MICFSPDFTHPDRDERLRQVQRQKAAIDLTARLGARHCRTLSGQRYPGLGRDEGIARTLDGIMQYASQNLIPVTLELGGKSPNIFFESVMDADDDFFDKCLEGAALFALNQGEVCTCPSRILVQESIADRFIERVIERTKKIKMGHPLDPETMIGAQASQDQYEKILNYIQIGKDEGAEVLCGGEAQKNEGVEGGYYIQPTLLKGHNKMRVFQEEIFGPVTSITTFKDEADAISIANDTLYGLGAGVWTRDAHQLYQIPRAHQAGRVWVTATTLPAHARSALQKSGSDAKSQMMLDITATTEYARLLQQKANGFFKNP